MHRPKITKLITKQWIMRTTKRFSIYLFLGFLMSWIISSALAFVPHHFDPGSENRSVIMLAHQDPSKERVQFQSTSSRWIGIHEQQFAFPRVPSVLARRPSRGVPSQLWWNWRPFEPAPNRTRLVRSIALQYAQILHQYDPEQHELLDVPSPLETQSIPFIPDVDSIMYAQIEYGFPAMSHRSWNAMLPKSNTPSGAPFQVSDGTVINPKKNPRLFSSSALFPYRPIWIGLGINSLFWGCVLGILISIKRAYRHQRRFHRGRCPICSYDLEFVFTQGCNECGWRKVH